MTIWQGASVSVQNTLEERVVDASLRRVRRIFNANYLFLLVDATLGFIYLKISEIRRGSVSHPAAGVSWILFIGEWIAARARMKNESDIFSSFAEDDTNMYV